MFVIWGDVRIDHGGGDIGVPRQFLNHTDIVAAFPAGVLRTNGDVNVITINMILDPFFFITVKISNYLK